MTTSTEPVTFPPIYSRGYLDGDRTRVYELDTRYADDPVCTFVLLRGPRYDGSVPHARMYTREADIRRFTPTPTL